MDLAINQVATYFLVFFQGVISFFSPCVLPLVPLYLAYLAGDAKVDNTKKLRSFFNIFCFTLGIGSTFFLLGFSFSLLGSFLANYRQVLIIVGGVIIIAFGLLQLFASSLFHSEKRIEHNLLKWQMNPFVAFLLGFFFSFAWTPCVGPTLSSVLILTSTTNQLAGFLLIACYTLGFIVPFWIVGILAEKALAFLKSKRHYMQYTIRIGAVLMIIIGVLMVTGYISKFSSKVAQLGNVASPQISQTTSTTDATNNTTLAPSQINKQAAEPTKGEAKSEPKTREYRPALDFELSDQNGQVHSLADYKGKLLILNFWQTWCGPCVREMPEFEALHQKLLADNENVAIVGISNPTNDLNPQASEVEQKEVEKFLSEHQITYPVLMDLTGEQYYQYGIHSFPTTIIITPDSKVYGGVIGMIDQHRLQELIDQAKKELNLP